MYYEFHQSVNSGDRNKINVAVSLLQSKLGQCVKFVQRSSGPRVMVQSVNGKGCAAYVGYIGVKQTVQLESSFCMTTGTIQHEFLHATGILHHQSRSDRDSHVRVLENNIITGEESNFKKYDPNQVSHYGLPYDFLSVMHYGKNFFSKDRLNTIEAIDSYWTDKIGQREGVSLRDVQLVQRHYGCSGIII